MNPTTTTAAALGTPRLPRAQVEIPDVGSIGVRGMSRAEVMATQVLLANPGAFEAEMLRLCVTDPKLTADEAATWRANAPAMEIEPVVNKILELSGMLPGAIDEAKALFPGAGEPSSSSSPAA